jgi:hypothetical protein
MSIYAAAELLESLPVSITLQVSRELKDSLRVANRESSVVHLQKRGADAGSADVEAAFPRVAEVRVGLLRVRKFSAGVSSAVAQVLVA